MAKLAGILPEKPAVATMIRSLVLFVSGLGCAMLPLQVLAEPVPELPTLLASADTRGLATDPGWLALLHYKRESLLPRFQSQADDPAFFLAAEGKTDPQAELHADLSAMLQPSASGHAQCLFPARWHWLQQQLDIRGGDVPCPKLDRWLEKMQSESVSLVFPAMFLNNPGSAFGHTFLRFNHESSDLLSQTLNYAAAAADANDDLATYVYKGLFGGYGGVFRTRPYYRTVQNYSNLENRDIWEYQLKLSQAEVMQLKRHIWEVVDIDFDYFFLRENCAYRLLALIDAVRPQAELSSFTSFPLYAIPVDTVRALKRVGLVQSEHYRPSLMSQIEYSFQHHADNFNHALTQLVDGEIDIEQALATRQHDTTRAALLSTAYRLLQFRGQQDSDLAKTILARRSNLYVTNAAPVYIAQPPEQGHESARLSLSAGSTEAAHYYELAFKPAFHELLDAPAGYVAGAEINAMDMRLRWQPDSDSLQLQQLRFFNVISLSPWRDWYRTKSWQLDIKLYRQFIRPGISDLVLNTRVGVGISQQALASTWYAMLLLDAEASDDYSRGYSLLPGLQLGVSTLFPGGQLLLTAEHSNAVSGFDFDRSRLNLGLQINLAAQSALRLEYEKTWYAQFEVSDLRASLYWYF